MLLNNMRTCVLSSWKMYHKGQRQLCSHLCVKPSQKNQAVHLKTVSLSLTVVCLCNSLSVSLWTGFRLSHVTLHHFLFLCVPLKITPLHLLSPFISVCPGFCLFFYSLSLSLCLSFLYRNLNLSAVLTLCKNYLFVYLLQFGDLYNFRVPFNYTPKMDSYTCAFVTNQLILITSLTARCPAMHLFFSLIFSKAIALRAILFFSS